MNQSDRYRVAWVGGVPVIRDTLTGSWSQPFFKYRPGGVQENARLSEVCARQLNLVGVYRSRYSWFSDGLWGPLETEAVRL